MILFSATIIHMHAYIVKTAGQLHIREVQCSLDDRIHTIYLHHNTLYCVWIVWRKLIWSQRQLLVNKNTWTTTQSINSALSSLRIQNDSTFEFHFTDVAVYGRRNRTQTPKWNQYWDVKSQNRQMHQECSCLFPNFK